MSAAAESQNLYRQIQSSWKLSRNNSIFWRAVCILVPESQHRVLPWSWLLLAECCQSQSEGAALQWCDQGQNWCWSWSFAALRERAVTFTSDSDTALQVQIFQNSMFSFLLHLLADRAQQDTHSSLCRAWIVLWRLQRTGGVKLSGKPWCFSLFLLLSFWNE